MQQHDEHDELTGAPTLRSLPRKNPFVVPEGFFDRFPHAVQQQAIEAQRTAGRGWHLFGRVPPTRLVLGGVAALAVAIASWTFWPASPDEPGIAEVPWTSEELLHGGYDVELLYTELHPDLVEMDVVALPDDDATVLAYLEGQNLPLDLLIEQL
ncbi:MAG: hypothetical protein KF797_05690 [Flavobacteriales bacterium]|nr:hypothetical protein [Flavobacteriales bacterium]